jgi:hypothetical protein
VTFTFIIRAGGAIVHAYICDMFRLIALTQGIILNSAIGFTKIVSTLMFLKLDFS